MHLKISSVSYHENLEQDNEDQALNLEENRSMMINNFEKVELSDILDQNQPKNTVTFDFENMTVNLDCDSFFETELKREISQKLPISKNIQALQMIDLDKPQIEIQQDNNMCYYSNGTYEGPVQDDKKSGYGIFNFTNKDVYKGNYENDLKHGKGKYQFKNGDVYEGYFEYDKKCGYGEYVYTSGSRYKGNWSNDKREGYGTFYFNSGSRYEGEFCASRREGKGIYYFINGEKYDGQFNNNKFEGRGVLWFSNNNGRYEGAFQNGEFDGRGKQYDKNGDLVIDGMWKNGNLIREYSKSLFNKYQKTGLGSSVEIYGNSDK